MDNVEIVDRNLPDGSTVQYVIIDRGNGEYTSMPKSVYDEQQAAQFLTNVPTTPQAGESA